MRDDTLDDRSDSSDNSLEDLVSEISDVQIQLITWGDDDQFVTVNMLAPLETEIQQATRFI